MESDPGCNEMKSGVCEPLSFPDCAAFHSGYVVDFLERVSNAFELTPLNIVQFPFIQSALM